MGIEAIMYINAQVEAILARHTPKVRSDECGTRQLSLADRLQIMSIDLCELQVKYEKSVTLRRLVKDQHHG